MPINEKDLEHGNWASIFIEVFGGTEAEIAEVLETHPNPRKKNQSQRSGQVIDLAQDDEKGVHNFAGMRGGDDVVQQLQRFTAPSTQCYPHSNNSNDNSNSNSNDNSSSRNFSNDRFSIDDDELTEDTNVMNRNKQKQRSKARSRSKNSKNQSRSKGGKLHMTHKERWQAICAFEKKKKEEKQLQKKTKQISKRKKKDEAISEWCPRALHPFWKEINNQSRGAIKRILKVCATQ